MKFGATIEANTFAPWRAYYLQYKALKKLISLIETASDLERRQEALTREQVAHKLRSSPLFDGKWAFLAHNGAATGKNINKAASSSTINTTTTTTTTTSTTTAASFKVTPLQLKQYFLRILDEGRIAIAALSVGAAQGCVDESVKYAKEREAFGVAIAW